MALETYRQKRNFEKTAEPRGKAARSTGSSYVIQKHDATRLHYDLRLEMDGVLKSWAVTKGPSLVAGEKRLAVHVEDHPLEYGSFEGTIPKGEYGGGTVIVWDRGHWQPVGDAKGGYAKGHLEFELNGEKLTGRWHLVRMHGKPGEKRENWLLIKGEDDAARPPDAPDILEEAPASVKTGRNIDDVAHESPGWSSKSGRITKSRKPKAAPEPAKAAAPPPAPVAPKGAVAAAMPGFVEPALATLVKQPPSGPGWVHEIKFDGYRLQVRIAAGRVKLLTRSGLDWTKRFGKPLNDLLASLPLSQAILDGELVVENPSGSSDFSLLQEDLSEGRSNRFILYLFDLLYLDGMDLRPASLIERKRALQQIVAAQNDPDLRFSEHFEESGEMVKQHACRLSLEGIISKDGRSPYRSGRGKTWVKSKCSGRQEFVIGGFVPSTVTRQAIGSLILGVHEADGTLRHVGRVGTGFTARVAEDLYRRLDRIRRTDSPFADRLTSEEARQARFVEPSLVAEVEFRAWTGDGHLRHASYRGIREDKPASEIVREAGAAASPRVAAPKVRLTHADRLYWPAEGVTKEGLANYYAEVWRFIAPHIVGRPLALLRCPTGVTGQVFFQKHAWKGINPNIRQFPDPAEPGEEPLLGIDDLDGLIGLAQSAALEIHPWGSTTAEWERPDRIIMDLDPGDGVEWQRVIDAALEVKARLTESGLAAFLKTSGGKGLHVVAPLKPRADWIAVKAFTKAMADAMAADQPDRYVSTISKAKRQGKILVDYLRNQRGATAVAPYSPRARPGAAVSTPIAWQELGPDIGSAYYTIESVPKRLAALPSDPWAEFRTAAVPLGEGKRGRKPRGRA